MVNCPWQLQIVKKSLKKKEKLKLLEKHLITEPSFVALDLGCAQGILSYFLRQKPCLWVSTDLDFANLMTSQTVIEKNLIQLSEGILPFKSQSFDLVVSLDFLEHLENDDQCLEEIHRVLKKEGQLVIAVPHTGKFFILHKLRTALGLKLEFYGHKREGYSLKELQTKLNKTHIQLTKHITFSRFFSESLELILNFLYIKFLSPKTPEHLRDGFIKPSTSSEFNSRKKAFKAYSVIYPLVLLVSHLDKLLFFQKGYGLMIWAKKTD